MRARLRRDTRVPAGTMLFRGIPVAVAIERSPTRKGPSRVSFTGDQLVVSQGQVVTTPAARTLERWLRRQAREDVVRTIAHYAERIDVAHGRVYIMDQRTKWGNCSALGNLSFNWRIVMAPEGVLHYVVAHEVLHLAVPDHSQRFWLTLQSLYPESDRARQWLAANADHLRVDLAAVISAKRDG